jgi:hypothetical protein
VWKLHGSGMREMESGFLIMFVPLHVITRHSSNFHKRNMAGSLMPNHSSMMSLCRLAVAHGCQMCQPVKSHLVAFKMHSKQLFSLSWELSQRNQYASELGISTGIPVGIESSTCTHTHNIPVPMYPQVLTGTGSHFWLDGYGYLAD